jgi:titin
VSLSWTAPQGDGGEPISDYQIEYLVSGGAWTVFNDGVSLATTVTVTGLTRGLGYQFRVKALNAINSSSDEMIVGTPAATSQTIIPAVNPSQVRNISIPNVMATGINLVWSAPLDDGGRPITDYLIEYRLVASDWVMFADSVSTATIVTVTGLTQGQTYEFRISAISENGTGDSLQMSGVGIPSTVPDAPVLLNSQTVISGTGVQIFWNAPFSGGRIITDYELETNTGSGWVTFADGVSSATSATITGLTRGTVLRIRIRAVNAVGSSSYSHAFQESLVQIAPGRHSCAVGVSGSVWCWGLNSSGQVGDGTTSTRFEMQRVPRISNATKVAVGFDFSCALLSTGEVSCWGANANGQLGNGNTLAAVVPQKVLGVTSAIDVDTGAGFACAALSDSSVKCWGSNTHRQLGDGSTAGNSSTAVVVAGLNGITKVALAASTACALNTAGSVSCWGLNSGLQTGTGISTTPVVSPMGVKFSSSVFISGMVSVESDYGSNGFCGTTSGGAVNCWGASSNYARGDNSLVASRWAVTTIGSGISKVAVGSEHACALSVSAGGTIRCWGYNLDGQASGGLSRDSVLTPSIVVSSGATDVMAGEYVSCLKDLSGSFSCWGNNKTFGLQNSDAGLTGGPHVSEPRRFAVITRDGPSSPTNLQTSQATQSSISVSWAAPSDNGGAALFDYILETSVNGAAWSTIPDGIGTATSYVHSGLNRGANYLYRVAAVNEGDVIGSSATLGTAEFAATPPGQISNLSSTDNDASSVSLSWSAPSDDGGRPVTDYQIEYLPAGGSWIVFSDGVTATASAVVTGLAKGVLYQFRISAVNAEGTGATSTAIGVVPAVVPGAVQSVAKTTHTRNSVGLSWVAPVDNGGQPISDYVIDYRLNNGNWTRFSDGVSTSTNTVVTGLTQGLEYQFRVAAVSVKGEGSVALLGTTVVPRTVPGSPQNVRELSHTGSSVTVAWDSPLDDGGLAITDYVIEYRSVNGSAWTVFEDSVSTNRQIAVSSLEKGTTYMFRISAISAEGTGLPSTQFASTNIDVLLPEISWGKVACSVGVSGLVWCSGAAQAGPVLGNGYDRVPIEGVSDAKQVSVGADHTCALLNSGTVKCWGFNGWGQLGNGSMITPSSPVDVVGLSNVVQVEAGQTFTCARKSDGTVWCWGNGDVNRNGTGTTTSTPVRLTSISGATDLSVGDGMGCVVVSGNVRCWGYVANGRLGNPSNASNTNVPQIVRNTSTTSNVTTNYLTSVVEISSSANAGFTCARRSLGTVFCWGDSAVGQVGLSSGFSTFARQISGVTTAQSLGLGTTHACVLVSGGSVSCWGWNAAGMIGDGTIGTRITPVTVIGSGATSISAGHLNSSAVVNGRQYIWGDNDFGQQSRPISSSITDDLLSPTEMAPLAMGFVIPATVPGSPVLTTETHASTTATLNWSAPADDGGRLVSDYIIEYKLTSGSTWIRFEDGISTSRTVTVTGLTRGLSYDFRIAARNIEGDGPFGSSISVIPSVVPAAVTSVSVPSYSRTSVDLTWAMPSDNGGQPVTDYRIEYRKNPEVVWSTYLDGVSSDTEATVLGLARGTYSFRISAINANGAGTGTSISGVIPAVVPLAPVITSMFAPVSGGSAVANIAAVDDGGRDIDLMQFRLDGGTWESAPAWTANSVTINGLQNGRTYVVDVRARNPEGFGTASNSLSVIPASTPTAPSITAVDRPIDGLKLSVSFSSATGEGREITTYQYSLNGSVWLNRNDGQTVTSPLLIDSGLTNGTTYSVQIRAVNAQGNGQSSNSMSQVPGAIPSAPTITRLEPSNAGMGIVFSVPSSNGGLPISNYEYSTNGGQTWITRSPSAVTSPWTITGLLNGVSYTVVLRAVNAQGGGTESNSLAATPAALPSSPTISSITRPTAGGMLDVEFVAPNSDGGAAITKYQYSLNGGSSWLERTDTAGPTVSPMRILGLTNGSSYQITIRAANAQGSGVSSQIFAAVPATIPSAPAISSFTTPTVGGEVDVSFSAALSNGASITGHEYSVNNGVTWQGRTDGYTTETPMTIDGLTNGTTYLIRIRAVNAQGSGQPSSAIAATPATIPGRASIASLEYGESRIFVNVTAPGNGGSAITSYAYSIDGEETWYDTNSSSTSFSIGGLVNGRTYAVAVSAENRQGYGESSGVSYVTIGAQPNAVTTGAADVTASTVRLEGQVSANFVPTTTEFQLSTTSNFSSIYKTVAGFPLSGATLTNIAVDVSDIVESTTYFYRIVARNALGATFGSVLSFRTNGPLGITANNGSIYTNSTNVSMGVSWPRGSTAVILSNDGGFGVSSRFSLSELIPWTLQSSGNERLPKTVYARFVLADGSRSSTYTDDIILDETAPVLQDVISSLYEGDTVSVASLSKRMLSVRASDGNSGVARFELRSSAVAPSVFVSASNPEATQHSVAVTSGSSVIEVRVFDRAGNASGWKPVTLNSSASGSATATPTATKPTVTATVKLSGTTARVSVKLPSTMAKTCATKVVKGKKTSVCTPATIVVSVSGGGSKTVKAKAGSNAIVVPKAKKGATVTIKVNGKVVQKIKM